MRMNRRMAATRLILAGALTLASLAGTLPIAAASGVRETAATVVAVRQNPQMPWNAVVVDARGRFIVGSPRWTGNGESRPTVAIAGEKGELIPYPDAAWNSWVPGRAAAGTLVSVNAIHRDAQGYLWIVDSGAPEFGGAPLPGGPKVVQVDPRTDQVLRVYVFPPEALRAGSYVDDIRVHGRRAYLTDAGEGAVLVLNLDDGQVRRRFDGQPFARRARGTPSPSTARYCVPGTAARCRSTPTRSN